MFIFYLISSKDHFCFRFTFVGSSILSISFFQHFIWWPNSPYYSNMTKGMHEVGLFCYARQKQVS